VPDVLRVAGRARARAVTPEAAGEVRLLPPGDEGREPDRGRAVRRPPRVPRPRALPVQRGTGRRHLPRPAAGRGLDGREGLAELRAAAARRRLGPGPAREARRPALEEVLVQGPRSLL